MITYEVKQIPFSVARDYIKQNHYSHGCHNGTNLCFGIFDNEQLIGALMFATPCSEAVRSSVFGEEYKNHVTELHRLHILDCTPKNTESFSDLTEGHTGVIYKATNAYRLGSSTARTFYIDQEGRLRHPRQCGINITKEKALELGWKPVKREGKNRYLFLLPNNKWHRRELIRMCKYDLKQGVQFVLNAV
jgi:hypothetical protein